MKPMSRVLVPLATVPLIIAGLVIPGSSAVAAGEPSATIGEVTCVDEDGSLSVTLDAGDADQTFIVLVDGSSTGDDPETPVAAGGSANVDVSGLEDGPHTVEVLLAQADDTEDPTIASAEVNVACDVAPEGPYTNAKGAVYDGCEGVGQVSASNKAIAGDTADLQPVEFEVAFTPTDDPTDDPTDGGTDGATDGGTGDGISPEPRSSTVGVEEVLDTFTLDADNQTYDRTFDLSTTGDLVLRTGETVIASAHIYSCLVLAAEGSEGPPVPDTGF